MLIVSSTFLGFFQCGTSSDVPDRTSKIIEDVSIDYFPEDKELRQCFCENVKSNFMVISFMESAKTDDEVKQALRPYFKNANQNCIPIYKTKMGIGAIFFMNASLGGIIYCVQKMCK